MADVWAQDRQRVPAKRMDALAQLGSVGRGHKPASGTHEQRIARCRPKVLFQAIFDAYADGEERFELDHVFISGNEAAIFAKIGRKVKATGKSFYADICQRITVKDRLITRLVVFEDSHRSIAIRVGALEFND
jgi:hypothetical protein